MNCNEARRHWMLFLDSEGDPELHLRIRDHLGECSECASWFANQQMIEHRLTKVISLGQASPQLWRRVLSHSGLVSTDSRRTRWPLVTVAATATVALTLIVAVLFSKQSFPTELARNAADWHEHWQAGHVRLDLLSNSDHEVDRYLKERVPFRILCPPRKDVQFSVQGAGVCLIEGQRQAAYIVGSVDQSPVTILVLDKNSLQGFPQGVHLSRERTYKVASAVIAENVVVVIGKTTQEVLERLLNAYGSYHDS